MIVSPLAGIRWVMAPDASHLDRCTRCARRRPAEPDGEAWLWLRAEDGGGEHLLCAACAASPGVSDSVLSELRRRAGAYDEARDSRFSRPRVSYRLVPAARAQ